MDLKHRLRRLLKHSSLDHDQISQQRCYRYDWTSIWSLFALFVRRGWVNSLAANLAELPLQRRTAFRLGINVDSEVSSNLKICAGHEQVMRDDAAGCLLTILAMAEARNDFLRWSFDIDGDRAAKAMSG